MLARSLLCALLVSASALADPATQPAKPRSDERQVKDEQFGYTFNVPRIWKAVPQSGKRSIHIFQIPAPDAYAKALSSWIVLAEPKPAHSDLQKVADHMRETILKQNQDAKIISEGPATIIGRDGYEFLYSTKLKVNITNKVAKEQKEETEYVPAKVRCSLFFAGEALYQFVLTSDEKGFDARAKQAQRVVDTFVPGA
jgi:hypothetical protein